MYRSYVMICGGPNCTLLAGRQEKLAEEFSSDPEQVLPEAGPLESARAYREKKAKPLWAKIVKVLRSVYRAYFDLKSKFERLQSAYDREVSKNGSLSARIYEVCAERDGLKGQVRDYAVSYTHLTLPTTSRV